MKPVKSARTLLLLSILASLFASPAIAHPGHGETSPFHGILHTEHLLILLGIVVAIGIAKAIQKYL